MARMVFYSHTEHLSELDWLRSGDEERASARGKTDISRMLANPHRALRTTRQSNTRTTALIFRVFVRSEGELYEVSISM